MIPAAALGLILSAAQAHWLTVSYNLGEKYGLGYTLSALAWQESSFCKFPGTSWSAGCLGLKRSTARVYGDNDSLVTRQELRTDDNRNLRDGLSYVRYCQRNTKTWRRMVACFHYGLPVESKMSDARIDSDGYVLAISAKVKELSHVRQTED